MEEKEFNTTFAIPANYTDSGKIFGGMLEPRNAVEALILILIVGYPELMLIPMATTIRIVVMTVTLIPIGLLAAMGIDGDSLFQYEKALRRYSVGNRYVGTVSMVDVNGVFVALDGGIDCLCSYPKRGRPPRGARVTVRILGINHETNRIWGAITHIAMPH